VRNRLQTYAKQTQPLIDHYSAKGVLKTFTVSFLSPALFVVFSTCIPAT
jgi:hypothetical protein